MNPHLRHIGTRAALASLLACLAMPAVAQHAAQQQMIRQQHRDMQHRQSNPNHPGYRGGQAGQAGQQQQPRMPEVPAAPLRGYEVDRSYATLIVSTNGNKYINHGSTVQEAQARALQECKDHDRNQDCTAIATVSNACVGYTTAWAYARGGKVYTRFYVTPTHNVHLREFYNYLEIRPEHDLEAQAKAMCRSDTQTHPDHSCSSTAFTLCAGDSVRAIHY